MLSKLPNDSSKQRLCRPAGRKWACTRGWEDAGRLLYKPTRRAEAWKTEIRYGDSIPSHRLARAGQSTCSDQKARAVLHARRGPVWHTSASEALALDATKTVITNNRSTLALPAAVITFFRASNCEPARKN